MPTTSLGRILLASCCLAAVAHAQIGDVADRPGEVQKSLVPAHLIPPGTPRTPEEALKSFTLAPGFKLELAACEPLVQDPVAIAFGTDGRLWVVEMRGFMADIEGNGEDAPIGRVVVLTDRDGDGRYDESQVFVDHLVLPRAITLVGDGALIGAPPELAFWRDADGDGKADQKTLVAGDYGVRVDPKRPELANPERAPNSLLWAYDNWIYSTAYTKKFRFAKGQWETAATSFRGQWGLGQDDHGRLYYGSNSDQLRVDVIPSEYLQRNPNYPRLAGTNVNTAADQLVWPARVNPGINRGYRPEMLRGGRLKAFTAACGPWIYRGDLLPEFNGNAFVAEPSANLVRRSVLTGENGTVRGRNAYDRREFIASTDERFRPVGFSTGPDGALYIVDFYRGVIEHRISLTSYLRKQSEERGLVHPQHLGRIYRVVPADKPAPRATRLAPLTPSQWVERLSHPNSWWRETAQRILIERGDPAVVPAIRRIATAGAPPLGRVHALWTLEGMGALDRATVVASLDHPDPIVRAMAVRLSERFLPDAGRAELLARLLALTKDKVPEVQLQAVLSLGNARDPAVDRALAETARTHPGKTFLCDALYSGLAGRELPLLEHLVTNAGWKPEDADANQILSGLAGGIFTSRQLSAIERLFSLAAAPPPGSNRRTAALVDGIAAAAGASRRPLQFAQAPAGWKELVQHPAYKARLARLDEIVVWPGKPGVAVQAAVTPLTAGQQTRFEAGKTLFTAVCAACHQIDGRGLDGVAPPLLDSEWVLGSPERIVRIILHGVRGQITVLGRVHMGDMAALGALDDQQISSVLTYVRREWGHSASPIEPGQVKAIRAATAGRSDAWSERELQKIDPVPRRGATRK
ncbi:MAG: c-type cytochrome [Verrucomicrobia bacterium]|nr:c-type cytochrome [Verrucomicrobiota bacterium]